MWRCRPVIGSRGVLVDDAPLVAVAMTDARDRNLMREYYGAVAAAVQVVWPDSDGVLPWEEGARSSDAEQPVRGRPPAARPVYHANRLAVTTKVLSDSSGLLVRMTRAPRACRPLAIAPPRPPEGELFA